jgi:hypothetical protein
MSPAATDTCPPRFDPLMSSGPTAATVGTFGLSGDEARRDGTARAEPAALTRLVAGRGCTARFVVLGIAARAPSARAAFRIP